MNIPTVIYALLGGILPALVWLYFWEREDSKRPEPKGLILRTFVLGACAVFLVLPLQRLVADHFLGLGTITFLLWAALEEIFKFGAAFFGGLNTPEDNEPLDPLIYMITAALGFVALENTLFILNPLIETNIGEGIITGGLRFVGASLLHTVSSGVIGAAFSLTFYKKGRVRWMIIAWSFVAAITIHTLFNLFLLKADSLGTFYTFATIWGGIALLLLFFEKAKRMKNT